MTRNDLVVAGGLAAAILALTAPVWATGSVFFNHGDFFAYHWPLRQFGAAELVSGRLPFWNPYWLLGVPHAANSQAVLFYPLALPGAFLTAAAALTLESCLHLVWAAWGAYALGRWAGQGRGPAAALALAYALCPFLVYRITAGIPTLLAALSWVPWAWLAWLGGGWALLAAVWALQFLSGHPQFLVVNAAGMALWALLCPARTRLLARGAAAAAGAATLAAVQWPATWELLRGSNRSFWPVEFSAAYSLPPKALLSWLSPAALGTPFDGAWEGRVSEFYEFAGAWPGVLALALAAMGVRRGARPAAALALAAAGILLALGSNGPAAPLLLAMPGASLLRTPARWALLFVWGAWLAAGAGARAIFAGPRRAAWSAALPLAAFFELASWDARFLRPQDPTPFLSPSPAVSARLAGRSGRVLTDPALANPNKTAAYRVRNANGYEAFYPAAAAVWAARAEGAPAADSSRVLVSRWRSQAAERAGVAARLSPDGIEENPRAWPPAVFLDAAGGRLRPDPAAALERPGRWRVSGPVPAGAVALGLSEAAWPGWRARAGGASLPLEPWEMAFFCARLPPGATRLEAVFDFIPTLWPWAALLSATAWTAWLARAARAAEAA